MYHAFFLFLIPEREEGGGGWGIGTDGGEEIERRETPTACLLSEPQSGTLLEV